MTHPSRILALLVVGVGLAITAALASMDTGSFREVDAGTLIMDTDLSTLTPDPLPLPLDETGMERP